MVPFCKYFDISCAVITNTIVVATSTMDGAYRACGLIKNTVPYNRIVAQGACIPNAFGMNFSGQG